MKIHYKLMAALIISSLSIISCDDAPKTNFLVKGDEAFNNHKYEVAVFNYKEAIKADSNNALAYLKKGVIENIESDYKSALYDLNKAISLSPRMHDSYFFRGQVKDFMDDTLGAIKDYTEAIDIDDGDMDSFYARGLDKEKVNDNKGALDDYTRIIKINPLSEKGSRLIGSARWRRGIVETRMNDLKSAQEDFEAVLESSPSDRQALAGMAEIEVKLHNKQKAIGYYKEASKYCNMRWEKMDSLYYTGRINDLKGKINEAMDLYNKVLVENRFYSECNNARAADEIFLGRYDMAIRDLDSAIKYDSHYAEAYYNRGIAYEKVGSKDNSKADFERAKAYGYEK